ncbi:MULTISPECIES: dephospho-CoA kinase [Helicobacter]|uniref:Dephospho-CoA kinase n=1 Tax=Helicobacter ibis TaxID=2962633 RepID=A0ABT4VE72_9HELI|nr:MULTISPECIES: dephospho-CoA kinase [Helicobacter]MDA3966381.1 dephospho-CoA kinase [Helicobacter sp. WB40]MDA3969005.1 dephospho-CoA kinase [Helicobacter ibis]
MKFKYAIALTGGIGSGKSTTSSLLKLYGYSVICADRISHEVLEDNSWLVVERFGSEILSYGKVDRRKLGEIVFSNKDVKKELESILHPLIKNKIEILASSLEEKKFPYFIDIPLFYETRNYDISNVVLVYASLDVRLNRIMLRDNINDSMALKKIESQMSLDDKKNLASYVIYNNGTLEELQSEVEKYIKTIN